MTMLLAKRPLSTRSRLGMPSATACRPPIRTARPAQLCALWQYCPKCQPQYLRVALEEDTLHQVHQIRSPVQCARAQRAQTSKALSLRGRAIDVPTGQGPAVVAAATEPERAVQCLELPPLAM